MTVQRVYIGDCEKCSRTLDLKMNPEFSAAPGSLTPEFILPSHSDGTGRCVGSGHAPQNARMKGDPIGSGDCEGDCK